jgi:hypothetical protein
MKPEDLFDPESLPNDLQWILAQYRLHPDDPVFVLLGWHWMRMQEGEDTLRELTLELKTALDSRANLITEAANRAGALQQKLDALESALAEKPSGLFRRWDAEFQLRLDNANDSLRLMEKRVGTLLLSIEKTGRSAYRRQIVAGIAAGAALGVTLAVLLLFG